MPTTRSLVIGCLCALAAASAARTLRAEFVAPPLTLDPSVLALDAPASQPQDWTDKAKNPMPGLTWGADERMRIEYGNNFITLNEQAAGHEWDFFRYRTRLWASISPCADFTVNVRLIWEGRHWQNPTINDEHSDPRFYKKEWDNGQAEFDTLNVKLNLAPLNTTVTAGRQDIVLGDGWLVLEGTPYDGSTTIYFDAVRSTTQFKDIQTALDLIYINQYSSPDHWLPAIGDSDQPEIENNERGAIVWLTNKSIQNLEIDPYFIYKHDSSAFSPTNPNAGKRQGADNADIYTFGTRLVENFTPNLMGRVEMAGQFGQKRSVSANTPDVQSICAWGMNSRLDYNFNDAMKNEFRLNFEYLSGNDNRDGNFDPLWGRWPQFSELYVYTYAKETRIANTTNLLRIGTNYLVRPTSACEIELDYNALFANHETQNTAAPGFAGDGNFRGHLFSAIFRYKFNSHLAGHIWSEYLVPGNFYPDSNRDNAIYLRGELVLTF